MVSSLSRIGRRELASSVTRLKTVRHRNFTAPAGSQAGQDVSDELRQIMRNVPQPVAIAVTRRPDGDPAAPYHGATLSSFTSLTLHPHPLVAFSLRLPSKLADYLRSPITSFTPSHPVLPQSMIPGQSLTISLLSQAHASIAQTLSKSGADHSNIIRTHFDQSDPPGLSDAVGRLRCEVVTSLPLRDVCGPVSEVDEDIEFDDEVEGAGLVQQPTAVHKLDPGEQQGQIHGSELFICRVIKVEHGQGENAGKPMLYWKQRYTSVQGS